MFKFENGNIVQDVVTSLKGVVMCRINYLTGCNQYGVSPQKLTSAGKRPDWEYIDENRLVLLKRNKIKLPKQKESIRGADGNLPSNERK